MNIFNGLVVCMDTVAVLPHAHIDSLHTHTMDKFTLSTVAVLPHAHIDSLHTHTMDNRFR